MGSLYNGDKSYKHMFKIVLTGDQGVGKSQLLSRFTKNEFCLDGASTIGIEFSTKEVQINGNIIRTQIWDTAGQERFMAITKPYYRNAFGALLVFDIQRSQTFEHLDRWYNEICENAGANCCILLVGNKCDQHHMREVMSEDAQNYASERNIQYMETSALDATNVEQAFLLLIQDIYKRYAKRTTNEIESNWTLGSPTFTLPQQHNKPQPKEYSCC